MAEERKPYTLSFEERNGYLYAFVCGEKDSLETSLAYWAAIAAECKARNVRRVLVEEDFKTQLSLTDMFLVASKLPELGPGLKAAFVDRQPDHHSENMFGEKVVRSHGGLGRVFQNVHDAEAWLLNPSE
jgi:hypothetical protein